MSQWIIELDQSRTETTKPKFRNSSLASKKSFKNSNLFIIDNGSCVIRAGYSDESDDAVIFCMENVVHKFPLKDDSTDSKFKFLFGNEKLVDSSSSSSSFTSKSSYDQNILTNFDIFELQLEHIFLQQQFKSTASQFRRLVITESIGTLASQRSLCNQLLFEGFAFDSITYGFDAFFNFYFHHSNQKFGLSIMIGNKSTHIVPIIDGLPDEKNIKRLNIGGFHMQDFMLRSLQLKYPSFPYILSSSEAASFVYQHCKVAENFIDQLNLLLMSDDKEKLKKNSVVEIQFAIPPQLTITPDQKAEEEAKKLEAEAKRKEFALKMKIQADEARRQKLKNMQCELEEFTNLYNLQFDLEHSQYVEKLNYLEFEGVEDLKETIQKIRESINGIREKIGEPPLEPCDVFDKPSQVKSLDFSLLSIPDEDLDEMDLKEKRKLRMIKNSQDARDRIKAEKIKLEQDRLDRLKQEDQLREENFSKWLMQMHSARQKIKNKLKKSEDHSTASSSVSHRDKKLALLRKMSKMISTDEDDFDDRKENSGKNSKIKSKRKKKQSKKSPSSTKLKRKGAGKRADSSSDDESNFGADDNDWLVYHDISKEQDQEDEEERESLQEELNRIEESLLKWDPDFSPELLTSSSSNGVNDASFIKESCPIFNWFIFGDPYRDCLNKVKLQMQKRPIEDFYKIVLGPEIFRIPEILFQPHIIGIDQCGISECILDMIKQYPNEVQQNLLECIHICGSPSRIPGFSNRIYYDLKQNLPQDWIIKIHQSENPMDSWNGAEKYVEENFTKIKWIQKEDYEKSNPNCFSYCHSRSS